MSTSAGLGFQKSRKGPRILLILTVILLSTFYLPLYLPVLDTNLVFSWTAPLVSPTIPGPRFGTGLAVFDAIYVVSLPSRTDRRDEMDSLAGKLDLHWTYVDAVSARDSTVEATLRWVKEARASRGAFKMHGGNNSTQGVKFSWPTTIDSLALSHETLDAWDTIQVPSEEDVDSALIPVATDDNEISPDVAGLPGWMILTPSRVACWQSHLNLVQRIANDMESKASLILEDDVDMERDIDSQLTHLWKYLPVDWDIVFLGHCWSNESTYPALSAPSQAHIHSHALLDPSSPLLNSTRESFNTSHRLHQSLSPKCTHAYALSHMGARRLLLHLQYPPFAFSRAIDQALAWLIQSGRLKSFSIVPSLIVQRKISKSDIDSAADIAASVGFEDSADPAVAKVREFGGWREVLVNGVFGGGMGVPDAKAG